MVRIARLEAVDVSESGATHTYGQKATGLQHAARAGLNTPKGFVLTVHAHRDFLECRSQLSPQLQDEIKVASRELGARFVTVSGPTPTPGVSYVGMNDALVLALADETTPRFAWLAYARFIRQYACLVFRADPRAFDDAERAFLNGQNLIRITSQYDAARLARIFKVIAGCPIPETRNRQLFHIVAALFDWYPDGDAFRARAGIVGSPAVLVTATCVGLDMASGVAWGRGRCRIGPGPPECSLEGEEPLVDSSDPLVKLMPKVAGSLKAPVEIEFVRVAEVVTVTRVRADVLPPAYEASSEGVAACSGIGFGAAVGAIGKEIFACSRFWPGDARALLDVSGAVASCGSERCRLLRYARLLGIAAIVGVPREIVQLRESVVTLAAGNLFGGARDVRIECKERVEKKNTEFWAVARTGVQGAIAAAVGAAGVLVHDVAAARAVVLACAGKVPVALVGRAGDLLFARTAAAARTRKVVLMVKAVDGVANGVQLVNDEFCRASVLEGISTGGDWKRPAVQLSAENRVEIEFGCDCLAPCYAAKDLAGGGRFFVNYSALRTTAKMRPGPMLAPIAKELKGAAQGCKLIIELEQVDDGSLAAVRDIGVSGVAIPAEVVLRISQSSGWA